MDSKKCTKCGELKLLTEFHKDAGKRDGRNAHCKACYILYGRSKIGVVARIYSDQKSSSKKRKMDPPVYSKLELQEWLFNQDLFHKLFNNWVESDYLTDLKPSCDRLNDYLSYSFDNIRLVTWEENNAKGHADSFSGINKKQLKAVVQLSLSGEFVNEFYSVKEAFRRTGIDQGNISAVCLRERKTAGGFKWKFKDELETEKLTERRGF